MYDEDEGVDRGEKDGSPGDYDEDGEMKPPRESNFRLELSHPCFW